VVGIGLLSRVDDCAGNAGGAVGAVRDGRGAAEDQICRAVVTVIDPDAARGGCEVWRSCEGTSNRWASRRAAGRSRPGLSRRA
jgi:hypothetical protein